VIIDNEYCHKNKCYGQFIPFENKIIIAKSGYKRAKKEHTYYERAKTLVDIINNNKI
jgi:spore maturation protein CgeB